MPYFLLFGISMRRDFVIFTPRAANFRLHTQNYYLFYTHTHTRNCFLLFFIDKRTLLDFTPNGGGSFIIASLARWPRAGVGEGRTNAIAFGPKTFPGRQPSRWAGERQRCNAKLRMHSCVKMILKLVPNDDDDDNQKAFAISNDGGNTQ